MEVGNNEVGSLNTKLYRNKNEYVVNGEKYYTTGTIFAECIDLLVQDNTSKEFLSAIVANISPQVTVKDDWNGFGQKTTGSGTTILKNVAVAKEDVFDFNHRFKYQTAFYQTVLNATLSGIAQHAIEAFSEEIKNKKRVFSHGNTNQVRNDPQVLQIIGKAIGQTYASQAIVICSAEAIQKAYEIHFLKDKENQEDSINDQAELESAKAQVVVIDLVLDLTSKLFNTLSASAASNEKALDRFWRNARVISSHNPVIYKERIVADWTLNNKPLPYAWRVGLGQKSN